MAGREFSKTLGLVGGGFGMIMFLVFGLYQGTLIGGTAGLQLGSCLFGDAASAEFLGRIMGGLGMVVGALLAGVIFLTSGMAVGRLAGYVIGGAEVKEGGEVVRPVH